MSGYLTSSWYRDLALAIVASLALYAAALHHPFQYDDKHAVKFNPHIRSLATTPSFFVDLNTFSSDRQGAMFRPLLLTTFALNYAVHGQATSGYRLVNVVLHGLCGWLAGWLTARLLGRSVGVVTAAVFVVHPVHAEAIHLVNGRSDLIAAAAVLGGLALFLRAREPAALGTFALGLLAKSTTIVLPVFVFVHDLWRGADLRWRRYVALAIVSAAYVVILQGTGFLASSAAKSPRGIGTNLLTQIKAIPYYVWLFVQPVHLSVDHQFFVSWEPWRAAVLLPAAVVLSAAYWVWRARRCAPALAAGWAAVALLPTLLVPLNILVSERRAYLALLGFCVLFGWAWCRLEARRQRAARHVAPMAILILAAMTISRFAVWSSELSLWEHTVRSGPWAYRARVNLAMAFDNEGREAEAERQLQYAVDINPDGAEAWSEFGVLRFRHGRWQEAETAYRKALARQPGIAGVHYNLGNALLRQDRLQEALDSYHRALELDPEMADIYNNLGLAYRSLGQPMKAMEAYERVLELDDSLIQVWFNLGVLAIEVDRPQRAIEALTTFVIIAADDPIAVPHLARASELLRELGANP